MTREAFNKIASANISKILGFGVDCALVNTKNGAFISVIASGNREKEISKLPNVENVEFDEELNETFAYLAA